MSMHYQITMPRKKSKNNYFTKETEDWIVIYNNTECPEERNKIFRQHIHYPLWRLAEAIIHTYKFYHTDVESIDSLINEVVSMLVDGKLEKFNPEHGAKAFSYFGTIVKRWLINYDNQNYNRKKKQDSFKAIESSYQLSYEDREAEIEFIYNTVEKFIEVLDKDLNSYFINEDEISVANAILVLFKDRRDIEIFKKKALYIYIREMTDCNTSSITKVITILKAIYKDTLQEQLKIQN